MHVWVLWVCVLHYVTLCDKSEVASTAQCGVVQHELSIAVTVTWQPPMWHRHHQPQSGSAAVDTRQKLSTIVILSGYSVSSSYIVNFLFPFCLVTIWWDERRVMSFRNWLARITIIRKVTTLVSYCFVDHKVYHTVRQMLFINQTIPANHQLEGLVVFHIFMSKWIIFGEQKLKVIKSAVIHLFWNNKIQICISYKSSYNNIHGLQDFIDISETLNLIATNFKIIALLF